VRSVKVVSVTKSDGVIKFPYAGLVHGAALLETERHYPMNLGSVKAGHFQCPVAFTWIRRIRKNISEGGADLFGECIKFRLTRLDMRIQVGRTRRCVFIQCEGYATTVPVSRGRDRSASRVGLRIEVWDDQPSA
jgi:hypothetical protein